MDWYYDEEDRRVGPVSSQDLEDLARNGTITADTNVWSEESIEWLPYSQAKVEVMRDVKQHDESEPTNDESLLTHNETESTHAEPESTHVESAPTSDESQPTYVESAPTSDESWLTHNETEPTHVESAPTSDESAPAVEVSACAECGSSFQTNDMIEYEGAKVCSVCKPVFFHKVKEGAHHGVMVYGGFWIRFAAKFIDGIILCAVFMVFVSAAILLTAKTQNILILTQTVLFSLQIAIPIAFTTFFVGKYAATPGKMICGLKIVTADGDKVSYLRAAGRHFSEYISMIIFSIGYIMAAFDGEKRSLHDRICSTRVIKE